MRIYLFRGLLGNFFSTGMDKLARKLNETGHTATVHSWINRKSVERGAKNSNEPIVLIGHSLGGNSANYCANNLQKNGNDVLGLFCIDATSPKDTHGISGYSFCSRDIRAKHVKGLDKVNLPHLNHIQIDKYIGVHSVILNKIEGISDGA